MSINNFLTKFLNYKFVTDSAYSFISFLILSLSGIITNIIIGNAYGTNGLGVFNQSLALLMIFSLISIMGLNISCLKFVSQYKGSSSQQKEIYSSSSYMAFCLSVIIGLTLYFIIRKFPSVFFNKEVTHATGNILLCLPFFTQNKIYMALMNGLRHIKVYSFVQTARWILIIGFICFAVFLNKTIYFICYCFLFSEICIWIVSSILYGNFFTIRFSSNIWFRTNLTFGSKSVLLGFLSETNNKIDIFFIGFFLSNHYVGIYSFASTIVKGLLSISSVIQLNINPIISDLWAKKDIVTINKYTQRIRKIMFIIVTPVFICAAILYPIFLFFFMKDKTYNESIPVFYILLAGLYFPAIYFFTGAYFAMTNMLIISFKIQIFKIIYNATSCAIFIFIFNFYGAAISTATTHLLVVFLINFYLKKDLNIKLFKKHFFY